MKKEGTTTGLSEAAANREAGLGTVCLGVPSEPAAGLLSARYPTTPNSLSPESPVAQAAADSTTIASVC